MTKQNETQRARQNDEGPLAAAIEGMKEGNGMSLADERRRCVERLMSWTVPQDIDEVCLLMELVRDMANTVMAYENQPRANGIRYLEGWREIFYSMADELAEVAENFVPRNEDEAVKKADILLRLQIRFGLEDPMKVVSIANDLILAKLKAQKAA